MKSELEAGGGCSVGVQQHVRELEGLNLYIIYIIIIIIKEIVFDVMLTIALQAFCVLDGSFPAIGGHTEAALGRFYLSYILYYILCILYILHIFYILYIFGKEEPKAGNRPSRVGTARSCVLTFKRFFTRICLLFSIVLLFSFH